MNVWKKKKKREREAYEATILQNVLCMHGEADIRRVLDAPLIMPSYTYPLSPLRSFPHEITKSHRFFKGYAFPSSMYQLICCSRYVKSPTVASTPTPLCTSLVAECMITERAPTVSSIVFGAVVAYKNRDVAVTGLARHTKTRFHVF